jgi:hypothetical protein
MYGRVILEHTLLRWFVSSRLRRICLETTAFVFSTRSPLDARYDRKRVSRAQSEESSGRSFHAKDTS